MKRLIMFTLSVLAVVALCQIVSNDSEAIMPSVLRPSLSRDPSSYGHVIERIGMMPIAFTANQGQWNERVKFRANARSASIWFTREGVYYQFARKTAGNHTEPSDLRAGPERQTEQRVIRASLVNANKDAKFVGEDLMEYRCNYFRGNDPDKWRNDVPNYGKIAVKDIYPGIDLEYYGNGKSIEYDFVLAPGVDPSQIEVCYQGAESIWVDDIGRLVVKTEWCKVVESAPRIYQQCDDGTVELTGRYVLLTDISFGFEIEEEYDDVYAVVIDPVMTYGTYLGGSQSDQGVEIATDGLGNIIVAGTCYSSDFPVENEYQTDQPDADFFVTKFTGSGDALLYSTYLGGNAYDGLTGLDADALGNAYVTGAVVSSDYPTMLPYMTDQPSHDCVVTKLNPNGNGLVFSTYLGGAGTDYGGGIAVGPGDDVYVTGRTNSGNFPVLNSYDPGPSGYDVFVTKFNSSGSELIYSSIVSGTYYRDIPYDIVVDDLGCAYVTGETESSDYATVNAYQTDQPGWDGFVTKFSPEGSSLLYSTYLGGNDYDCMYHIALFENSEVLVTGYSSSTDFPEVNAYQSDQPAKDAVVARFNSIGQPVYSTYLGGDDEEEGYGIAVDDDGNGYVTGWTLSGNFPLANPLDSVNNNVDIFVTKLSASGSSLIYSTYVAGDYGDGHGFDITLDQNSLALVTGYSWDLDATLPGALDPTPNGEADAILLMIEEDTYVCGDADGSSAVDIDDVVYLIAFIFSGGPEPIPYESGDADCSGAVDIDDVVYLIAFIFSGGPEPCDPDNDGVPEC